MIDAVSGAIYVIGGSSWNTFYNDVWASTDGGARAGLGRGRSGCGYQGVLGGTMGYLGGYWWFRWTKGALRGVLQGYCRGY